MAELEWLRVSEIYHAAVARDGAERERYLADACAGDDALRHEVESLLAQAFKTTTTGHVAELLDGSPDGQADPPGSIGPYRVLRKLGQGGMGVVYLAEQAEPLRRHVAIKVIKIGMDTRDIVARFNVERQALARMDHPNIAHVYDAGATGDGRPYFVMEYVAGTSMTEFCDARRLPTRFRLELFLQVCSAIQHAHQKGVIHRDLKPSNVLVTERDGKPLLKVIDFGIAKATEQSLTGLTTLTQQGVLVGTPEYMSPEQAALSGDIDTTTDVYSLGVLLYELLIGSLPFDPKVLRAGGHDELRRMIRESDPPKPSSRLTALGAIADTVASNRQTDVPRLARQLRGDLDWITLKALEKDRRRRYATVAAFAADVERYLTNDPVQARPPSATYRLRKFARRYRGAVSAGAALLVVLLAGLATSTLQYFRAERERIEANRQRVVAEVQRTEAEAQRGRAETKSAEAEAQRVIAAREEAAAVGARDRADQQRREAESRAYAATIMAADGELRANYPLAARQRLLTVDAGLRDWEWQHLFFKTDPSLATLKASDSAAVYLDKEELVVGSGGTRLFLTRYDTLDIWDAATYTHVTSYKAPGHILATDASGQLLVLVGSTPQLEMQLLAGPSGQMLHRWPLVNDDPECAALDAKGALMVVGFRSGNVSTWDLSRDVPHWVLGGQRNIGCSVTTAADGTRVALTTKDYTQDHLQWTVRVLLTDSGAEIARLDGTDDTGAAPSAPAIAFSPDGQSLAVGQSTGSIDLLGLSRPGAAAERFAGNPLEQQSADRYYNKVYSLAFSPDGTQIVSGADGGVGVWNVTGRKFVTMLQGHRSIVMGMAYAPDGHRFFSSDNAGEVRVWPSASPGATRTVDSPIRNSRGGAVGMSSGGAFEAIVDREGTVHVLNLMDGREAGALSLVKLTTPSVAKAQAASLSDDVATIRAAFLELVPAGVVALAVSADGDRIAFGTVDSTVQVARVRSGESAARLDCHGQPISNLAFTADGRFLAGAAGRRSDSLFMPEVRRDESDEPAVCVWDLATMKLAASWRPPRPVSVLVFRPDGVLILGSDADKLEGPLQFPNRAQPPEPRQTPEKRVYLWDWKAKKILTQMAVPMSPDSDASIEALAVSADGTRVAICTSRGMRHDPRVISIWDGTLSRELGWFQTTAWGGNMAFSPDGRRLVTGSADGTVRVWDNLRFELRLILFGERKMVADPKGTAPFVAFTPDGRIIATLPDGRTIWDVRPRRDR